MKIYFDKIVAWVVSFVGRVASAFEAVVDGLTATIKRVATNPKELAILAFIAVVLFDVIFSGKIGVISFLMTTLAQLVSAFATIQFGSLVVIAILVAIYLTNKK